MGKEILLFGDTDIETNKFYCHDKVTADIKKNLIASLFII